MRARGLLAFAVAAWSCVALAAGPGEKAVIGKIVLVPPELMASPRGGNRVDIHVRILNRNRDATLEAVTYVLKFKRAGKAEKALRADTVTLAHCHPMAVCNLLTITGVPLAEAEQLKLGIDVTGAKYRPASAPGR